jgi:hypothetical protein
MLGFVKCAGIAQLVERNLAKVEVASSNLVSRSKHVKNSLFFRIMGSNSFPFLSVINGFGAIAKRLCNGLQIRLAQFDSGSRLQTNTPAVHASGVFF